MKILFPSRPGHIGEVDSAFAAERDAAVKAGFAIGYVDIAGASFGDSLSVSSNVRKGDKALYRGWILRPEVYQELSTRADLVTSPTDYERTYSLPKWYGEFGAMLTPPTSWIGERSGLPIAEYVQLVCAVVKKDHLRAPFIVKDYLKSRKHEWYDSCYADTFEDLTRVVTNFVTRQLQDNSFVGGVVVRECVPLAKIGVHPKTQQPLGDEVRVYFWEGAPLIVAPYWHDGVNAASVASPMTNPKFRDFLEVVENYSIVRNHPFMSVDIGRLVDNTYTIIEIGDGGCSGIPESVSPDAFYAGIRAALDLKASFAQYFATMSATKNVLVDVNAKMDELLKLLKGEPAPVVEQALQAPIEPSAELRKRTCNRHPDCDAADAKARANGRYSFADHCHDDCCEDCFGY